MSDGSTTWVYLLRVGYWPSDSSGENMGDNCAPVNEGVLLALR